MVHSDQKLNTCNLDSLSSRTETCLLTRKTDEKKTRTKKVEESVFAKEASVCLEPTFRRWRTLETGKVNVSIHAAIYKNVKCIRCPLVLCPFWATCKHVRQLEPCKETKKKPLSKTEKHFSAIDCKKKRKKSKWTLLQMEVAVLCC